MTPTTEDVDRLILVHRKIKEEYVDKRLDFYIKRVDSKRIWAQRASVAVLTLSLVIPIVANLQFVAKDILVAIMSASIALITGFSQIHRWQDLWKEYSTAIVRIEAQIASWELKVAEANRFGEPEQISKTLTELTARLVQNVTAGSSQPKWSSFSSLSSRQKTTSRMSVERRLIGSERRAWCTAALATVGTAVVNWHRGRASYLRCCARSRAFLDRCAPGWRLREVGGGSRR